MKDFINRLKPLLIKGRNIIFLLILFAFSSCQNQEALDWVFSLQDDATPELPAPVGIVDYQFQISEVTGDPSFFINPLINNGSVDLYTVFLDVTNPGAGTLAQIREMSGDATGRVVFRLIESPTGSSSTSFSVNAETNEISFSFNHESIAYTGRMNITYLQKINRTLYVKSTMVAGSFVADSDGDGIPDATDNCPAVINPGQADADADGVGDACDVCFGVNASGDTDGDGYCASNDFDDNDANKYPGAPCSDGDACTNGDVYDASGSCVAGPHLNCDDGDPNTIDYCDSGSGCVHIPMPDGDGDGIPDALDNCPAVINADQADVDGDAIGDICDVCIGDNASGDADGDGYCANNDFDDNDANKYPGAPCSDGDACTNGDVYDANGSCVAGPHLNCDDGDPNTIDYCDSGSGCLHIPMPDGDGDGIPDATDNCPLVANADQADADTDTIGDVCDVCLGDNASGDADGDGYCAAQDFDDNDANKYPGAPCNSINECVEAAVYDANGNCVPTVFRPAGYTCTTGLCNGAGDCVATDSDGDGIPDATDNCPTTANADQLDTNGNGIGNACENNPPVIVNPIFPHSTTAGTSYYFRFSDYNIFSDPDPGDGIVSYSSNTLPSFVSLDMVDGILTGEPELSDAGEYAIEITVFDAGGLSVSSDFTLYVITPISTPNNDSYTFLQGVQHQQLSVLSNDAIFSGISIASITITQQPSNGSVEVIDLNVFYTHNGSTNLNDQFSYSFIDQFGVQSGWDGIVNLIFTADSDLDGVSDNSDNCPSDANADQADDDLDGIGNVCDICIGIDGTGDADGDGYCASVDCDDTHALINPGATDVAGSGIDANCDGNYLWYVDADGDTYGTTATVSSTNASPGAGESASANDCDDLVATTNPAGTDIAGSGIDANCDGNYLWYVDADGDTYGSTATVSSTNAIPGAGESASGDDCDDLVATTNPAGTDIAGSGIDSNCDGNYLWFVDSDGDSHGSLSTITSGNSTPGSGESAIGDDCNDTDVDVYPGAPTLPDGKDNNCDGSVDKVDQTISFDELSDQTLGDDSFVLSATSSSGLVVTFSSTSDKVQINSNLVTMTAAGRVSISAAQSGDDSYHLADEVVQSFCIDPEKPKISIAGRNSASPTLTSSSAAGNQWFLNGSAISGEVGQSLDITGQGQYAVQVSADDCVSELSEIKVFVITGDGNSPDDTSEMLVYPNPVRDQLFVSLQGFSKTETLEMGIYDQSGRLIMNKQVRSGDIEEVDVKQYAAGKYLLRVVQDKKIVNRQFIKE